MEFYNTQARFDLYHIRMELRSEASCSLWNRLPAKVIWSMFQAGMTANVRVLMRSRASRDGATACLGQESTRCHS